MISWQDAITNISQNTNVQQSETISIDLALDRIVSEDIYSPISLPMFDNSAMDGFAVNFNAIAQEYNVKLQPLPAHYAGSKIPDIDVVDGFCLPITTGAKIPEGFDTVIPIENTKQDDDKILFLSKITQGSNIRKKGSDIEKKQLVIAKGTKINGYHLAILGGLGIKDVSVYQKINVLVIISGDEIINDNEAQIFDANSPFINGFLQKMNVNIVAVKHVGDDKDLVCSIVEKWQHKIDAVITTGAVSMGGKDFIPAAAEMLDFDVIFHKVKQRPGKPMFFAKARNKDVLWFGMPGNPVAVQANMRFMFTSFYNKKHGLNMEEPTKAIFKGSFNKKQGMSHFVRGVSYIDNNGIQIFKILQNQQSYQVKNLGNANSWAKLDYDKANIEDGSVVDIFPL